MECSVAGTTTLDREWFKATPWAKQVISNTHYSTNPVKPIRRTRRGTKASMHVIRPIRVIVSENRTSASTLHHIGHNPSNLVQLTSDNTRSVPDSDRSSAKLINIIPSLIRQRTSNSFHQQSASHLSLAKIPKAIPEDKLITLFTLNCRSVKNKTLAIADFIQSHNADLLAITETWFRVRNRQKCYLRYHTTRLRFSSRIAAW
jgi:hypothetical protein